MEPEIFAEKCWPNWKIQEPLDSGSIGSVYRAVHRKNANLQSAVKIVRIPSDASVVSCLRGEGKTDEQIRQRLSQAAEKYSRRIGQMSRLKGDPHIVSIEDYASLPDEDGLGVTFCVRMELLKSLNDYLCDKKLSEKEVLDLGADIADALSACHQQGTLHLDVKPENLFVDDRPASGILFKLGDFSASRELDLADSIDPAGTLAYVPPEVIDRHRADVRSDLYSLGLTLYELLNRGNLPFLSDRPFHNPDEIDISIKTRLSGIPLPSPANASPRAAEVILKACAVDPDQRYASAEEMKEALRRAGQPEGERSNPSPSKRRLRPALVSAALLLLAVACLLFIRPNNVLDGKEPSATDPPLLEVNMQDPSLYASLQHRLSAFRGELERMDLLPDGGKARIPRSFAFFLDFIEDSIPDLPALDLDWNSASSALSISDTSPRWEPVLELRDGAACSFSQRNGRFYLPDVPLPDGAEPVSLTLHCAVSGLDCYPGFDAATRALTEFSLIWRRGEVSLVRKGPDDSLILRLELRPKGLPRIQAFYNADGSLQSIRINQRTYPYSDSEKLPDGVELIP